MRGHIRKCYHDTRNIVLDITYQIVPDTGKQKRVTVQGTKRDAERKLTKLLHNLHRGDYVEPSRQMVGKWLQKWLETTLKPRTGGSGSMRRIGA